MDPIKIRLHIGHATEADGATVEYLQGIEMLRKGLKNIRGVELLDDGPQSVRRCDAMVAEYSFSSAVLSEQMQIMSGQRRRMLWIFSAIGSHNRPILIGGPGSLQDHVVRFDQYPQGHMEEILPIVYNRLEYMGHDQLSHAIMTADRGKWEAEDRNHASR